METSPRSDDHRPQAPLSLPSPSGDPPWRVAHAATQQPSNHPGALSAADQQPLGIVAAAERLRLQHLLDPVAVPGPPIIRVARSLALGRSLRFAVRTTAMALLTALMMIYLTRPGDSPMSHSAVPRWSGPALVPTEPTPPKPAPPRPSPPPQTRADPADTAVLVRRGETFLANNDVISARLILVRAADSGDAQAAFLMGESYDPAALLQRGVTGALADPVKARAWYETSARLGDTRASQRLRQLDAAPRW